MVKLLIVLAFGAALGFWWSRKGKGAGTSQAEKEKSKEKILAYFGENGGIVTNDDVEKILGVADATATRYLEELEREGKIIQKGETGRGVYYEKI